MIDRPHTVFRSSVVIGPDATGLVVVGRLIYEPRVGWYVTTIVDGTGGGSDFDQL